jgi:polyvinyl alcohol dehydrogenase (cytochrome)
MTPTAITRALTVGAMREVGANLTSAEVRGIATYLGRIDPVSVVTDINVNRCAHLAPFSALADTPGWTGWGPRLDNARYQDRADAGLAAADLPRLKLKWAFGVPDAISMRSQPAVYAGRVFLGGVDAVYSLDAATGCLHWSTKVPAPVRSGITVASVANRVLAVFGDVSGRVLALDASSGQPVWQIRADEHPTTMVTSTPAFHNGRLYFGDSSYEETCARLCVLHISGQYTGRRCWNRQALVENIHHCTSSQSWRINQAWQKNHRAVRSGRVDRASARSGSQRYVRDHR